jgi:hypothetical protein
MIRLLARVSLAPGITCPAGMRLTAFFYSISASRNDSYSASIMLIGVIQYVISGVPASTHRTPGNRRH